MAIKRRSGKEVDPATAAAIEEFGAGAEAPPRAVVAQRPAVRPLVAAEPEALDLPGTGVAVAPTPTLAASATLRRVQGSRRVGREGYEQLAAQHAHLGRVDYDDLPSTQLIKHDASREAAMLVALLADVEDRSRHQVVNIALLEGLRAWSQRVKDGS